MEMNEVNEEANYAIQVLADCGWHTITNEYSASSSNFVAENIFTALKADARVLSKRTNQVIFEFLNNRNDESPTTD